MLRLGIVDFDSSHCVEFTRRFHQTKVDPRQHVDGAQVMLGCPGTSEMSPERIPGFTEQMKQFGVQLVNSPTDMIGQIDGVLILSLCGQKHLDHAGPFLQAGIPTYVDKPFTCSLSDAETLIALANENDTVLFSTSAMRYATEILNFQANKQLGDLHGVVSYGPAKKAEGNPGLFHYGIHPVEMLFTLMGTGCERVTNLSTEGAEVVTGEWSDGRIATLRGNRVGSTAYGFLAHCEHGVISQTVSTRDTYRNLCSEIVRSFETGQPAVPHSTTLEIVRFVIAAERSAQQQGVPFLLSEIND